MNHPAATLPYDAYSKVLWGSSYLDSTLGIYHHGYTIWRFYAGANIVLKGDVKNNLSWVGAGEAVNLATQLLQGKDFYNSFARTMAIGFYAMEALEHIYKTWEDIGKLQEAIGRKEPVCVIKHDIELQENAWVDPATKKWFFVSLQLLVLKIQRIAGSLVMVISDIFLLPYYLIRVRDAYKMDNFFEEEACKGMALFHAKLLIEKISEYQKLATTKNSQKLTDLLNTILVSSSVKNLKIDDAVKAAKKVNLCFGTNNDISLFGRAGNDLLALVGLGTRENSLMPMKKKTPKMPSKNLNLSPILVNNPQYKEIKTVLNF